MAEPEEPAVPGQLVLRVGDRRFTLALTQVEGVEIAPAITGVPGAPPTLRGLTNLHGSVVAVVDPDPESEGERRHLVVLSSRRLGRFALACDWVEDLAAGAESKEATPLDADDLGRAVIAAFEEVDQRLPVVETPTARMIPRKEPRG